MIQALEQHLLYEKVHEYQEHTHKLQPLIIPVVNMNGTSEKQLVEQLMAVMEALREVEVRMAAANPHGRDFQTIAGSEQMTQYARTAWTQRRALLTMVKHDVELLALAISRQGR